MNLPLFIANRIYKNGGSSNKRVSKPAITIAVLGITIGLVIMILSVAISFGFKQEIQKKVIGFGSHIQVGNFNRTESFETYPIVGNNSLMETISTLPQVSHAQRYTTKPGMLKTENNFQGMVLKGVGQEYDMDFIATHLVEGEIPLFTDSVASNEALISLKLAQQMNLRLGDKIYAYFIQNNVRARRFTIKGIYQTNFSEFDNYFILTDIYTANRLNNWEPDQVSGLEISIHDFSQLEESTYEVADLLNTKVDRYGNSYFTQSIEQLYPSIFSWLEVLDINVLVILILMIGVAGFTMISGLLILILERANMIGILKAMGATNLTIRKIFLYFAVFLIGKGLLWGNAIGLTLCALQSKFGVIRLDPETYYVEAVPVELRLLPVLVLNVSTLAIAVLMLIGPSFLISHIKPVKAIRFE